MMNLIVTLAILMLIFSVNVGTYHIIKKINHNITEKTQCQKNQ